MWWHVGRRAIQSEALARLFKAPQLLYSFIPIVETLNEPEQGGNVVGWNHALTVCAGVVMLAGCVQISEPAPSWPANPSAAEVVGALAGGALGGYVGSQFGAGSGALAMTGLGVTAGAALGRELAQNLETANRPAAQQHIVIPYGYCLRPLSGSASTARSLLLTPC
jgi:hypothetical protein